MNEHYKTLQKRRKYRQIGLQQIYVTSYEYIYELHSRNVPRHKDY